MGETPYRYCVGGDDCCLCDKLREENKRLREALKKLHQECSQVGHVHELLNEGPMIAPSERAVLEARVALKQTDPGNSAG